MWYFVNAPSNRNSLNLPHGSPVSFYPKILAKWYLLNHNDISNNTGWVLRKPSSDKSAYLLWCYFRTIMGKIIMWSGKIFWINIWIAVYQKPGQTRVPSDDIIMRHNVTSQNWFTFGLHLRTLLWWNHIKLNFIREELWQWIL